MANEYHSSLLIFTCLLILVPYRYSPTNDVISISPFIYGAFVIVIEWDFVLVTLLHRYCMRNYQRQSQRIIHLISIIV